MDLFETNLEPATQLCVRSLLLADRDGLQETYRIDQVRSRVVRTVQTDRGAIDTTVPLLRDAPRDPQSAFDWCWLRQAERPLSSPDTRSIRIADLFSGCAQMSLGASEACRALGWRGDLVLAIDSNPAAVKMCRRLYPDAAVLQASMDKVLGGVLGKPFTAKEREIRLSAGRVDLLVGGPPCQGHSHLNNKSRSKDKRNPLGFRMIRAAELLEPQHVIIENVLGIKNDRGRVFSRMKSGLIKLGYRVAEAVVRAEEHGVAQRRHRTILIGTRVPDIDLTRAFSGTVTQPRSFQWACEDLEDKCDSLMNRPPVPKPQNQERIEFLFNNNLYDLPPAQRPRCHQNGTAYTSSYGRIAWSHPVQTITTTFQVIGTGRFIHPRRKRPITLHEAARLQSIPDFVDFSEISSTTIARLIGNAVPPKLLYSIALRLISGTA